MKMMAFDLDGTLALSKSSLDDEMATLLEKLTDDYMVTIISGGDYPQFEKQVLGRLLHLSEKNLKNLLLLPTCGTKFFAYENGKFIKKYSDDIAPEDRKKIIEIVGKIYEESEYYPETFYGEIVEDRGSQITLSALGQQAPLEAKETWDSDQKKRKVLIEEMQALLPEFYFKLGGTTSIDITKKGIDKSFGMSKIMEITGVEKDEIVFVGDALYEGGNDYPVQQMGIKSHLTSGIEETKNIIKKYLNI